MKRLDTYLVGNLGESPTIRKFVLVGQFLILEKHLASTHTENNPLEAEKVLGVDDTCEVGQRRLGSFLLTSVLEFALIEATRHEVLHVVADQLGIIELVVAFDEVLVVSDKVIKRVEFLGGLLLVALEDITHLVWVGCESGLDALTQLLEVTGTDTTQSVELRSPFLH